MNIFNPNNHPFDLALVDLKTLQELCDLLNEWKCPARMGTTCPSQIDLDNLPVFSIVEPDRESYLDTTHYFYKSFDDLNLQCWGNGHWIILPQAEDVRFTPIF
ncbi:hypothetical protein [Psychromonas aquimarina]|uniref:hypothetical protein n=1 Tax=Psychromonas aquimarina TaxID=444919 RepID=UPI0004905DB3|nr:hypothetical protein [Psychromonas aquimarina]